MNKGYSFIELERNLNPEPELVRHQTFPNSTYDDMNMKRILQGFKKKRVWFGQDLH
jgi:hypothetical protein